MMISEDSQPMPLSLTSKSAVLGLHLIKTKAIALILRPFFIDV
jgi:hypothetical protein